MYCLTYKRCSYYLTKGLRAALNCFMASVFFFLSRSYNGLESTTIDSFDRQCVSLLNMVTERPSETLISTLTQNPRWVLLCFVFIVTGPVLSRSPQQTLLEIYHFIFSIGVVDSILLLEVCCSERSWADVQKTWSKMGPEEQSGTNIVVIDQRIRTIKTFGSTLFRFFIDFIRQCIH
jgi:hypothetical protein